MKCHQKLPHLTGTKGKCFVVLQCDYVQLVRDNCFLLVMDHIHAFTTSKDFHKVIIAVLLKEAFIKISLIFY